MTHAQLPLWQDKTPDQRLDTLRQMLEELYAYTWRAPISNLRHILTNHVSFDDKERQDRDQMLQLLAQYPLILSPACEVGHFTGSALVMDQQGRILLHYHRSLHIWLQFGGHADLETDFSQVALRETEEESGLTDLNFFPIGVPPVPIDIDVHRIPVGKGRPEHLHLDLRYLLFTDNPDAVKANAGESDQFRWVRDENHLSELKIGSDLARLIRKAWQIHPIS